MEATGAVHWEGKLGGTSMNDVGGAGFAGSSPPFLGRERATVDVMIMMIMLIRSAAALATMRSCS